MSATRVQQAGYRLKTLRDSKGWKQQDIERMTDGRLVPQQVSRIERGEIEKPAMADLVLLGGLYGLSPNQVADLYNYWDAPADIHLETYLMEAAKLPPKLRQRLYTYLATALTLVQHELATEEPPSA